jgi:hypothetical protein
MGFEPGEGYSIIAVLKPSLGSAVWPDGCVMFRDSTLYRFDVRFVSSSAIGSRANSARINWDFHESEEN